MPVFLTLGDGDFTYSLDLARYFAKVSSTTKNKLTATGVDSLKDMQEKYKDIDSTLQQIRKSACHGTLEVVVQHEINAISGGSEHLDSNFANVVIFNHPHLGTEDAARHGRFLHHFLCACRQSWLAPSDATVQLTLAAGQWERWKGEKAANKHGLLLKHRLPFLPPPVDNPKYQHRRHQTGKSFHARTAGSETFVLTREGGLEAYLFPWQKDKDIVQQHQQAKPAFACPSCERCFREDRALKSHFKAVHDSKKRKRDIKCPHCEVHGVIKIFAHEQSLMDHIQAKHDGLHITIKPEWADKHERPISVAHGECDVCGLIYQNEQDAALHVQDFLPSNGSTPLESMTCQFCEKIFHNRRAQLQHENFCAARCQDSAVKDTRGKQNGNVTINKHF